MGISNVSSYQIVQNTLADVNKVESNLTTEQEQLSSGNAAQNFQEMGAQTQQYLSMDNVLSRTNQYLSDNSVVESRINTTSSALTQIINAATQLQSLISTRMTGTSNDAAFGVQLQGLWQQIAGQLNSSVSNQYLFSGTATATAPVNSATPTLAQPGVPDAGYYSGSNQDFSVSPQDGTSVSYNVRADAPAFQQIYAAIATAQTGDAQNNSTILQQAETLVQNGLQGVIGIQSQVNAAASQFSTVDTNLNNQKLYWQGLQQGIGNTDIVSVSTQVAINQGILQAAFEAFSKISSLRLSDYLK